MAVIPKTILIVEDQYDNRAIYLEVLRDAGYHTLEAENGRVGVELALKYLPDLILMDLSMPLLDGWGAMELLRRDPKTAGIPVLALSAHVLMYRDFEKARQAGFAAYLTKPIEPKSVLQEIREKIGWEVEKAVEQGDGPELTRIDRKS